MTFIPECYFSFTSTEGTDHWEVIKLFTLLLHFFSFYTVSADIWSNCEPAFLSCFSVICLSDGPKMILEKLLRFSNYFPIFSSQEIGFIGSYSWVYNKCVFYSEFPDDSLSGSLWCCFSALWETFFFQNPFQHFMPPEHYHNALGIWSIPSIARQKRTNYLI